MHNYKKIEEELNEIFGVDESIARIAAKQFGLSAPAAIGLGFGAAAIKTAMRKRRMNKKIEKGVAQNQAQNDERMKQIKKNHAMKVCRIKYAKDPERMKMCLKKISQRFV